jgi:hypothetical protein
LERKSEVLNQRIASNLPGSQLPPPSTRGQRLEAEDAEIRRLAIERHLSEVRTGRVQDCAWHALTDAEQHAYIERERLHWTLGSVPALAVLVADATEAVYQRHTFIVRKREVAAAIVKDAIASFLASGLIGRRS